MNHPTHDPIAGKKDSPWLGDLKSKRLIWLKGILFLVLGVTAAIILVLRRATLTDAILIGITVWSFCRAYYFAFYVIEHYVDSAFRFDGLVSFARYVLSGPDVPSDQNQKRDSSVTSVDARDDGRH